jgi:hypothetical protein
MRFAAFLKGRGAAEKQPGLSTELKEISMATVTKLPTNKPSSKQATAGTVHWLDECIRRGESETFSEVTTVTPGLAGELLRRNPDNRPIRFAKLDQMISDIMKDRWTFNGEPIIISREGLVNDGQHRLSAVIEAKKPITTLVVFGVDRNTRITVDQGAARGARDYIGMEGVENATIIAGAGRLIAAYLKTNGQHFGDASRVSNADVMTLVHGDEQLVKSAALAHSLYKYSRQLVAPSIVAFCHYLLADIHQKDADAFIQAVCMGENIKRGDPAYAVRERFLAEGRISRNDKIEIILRGWNSYRQSKPLKLAKALGTLPALI